MFLSTEAFPQAHRILGIVNATSHLMLPSEAIDAFESFDQLYGAVEEKLKERAAAKGADGVVNVRFNTTVANVQVAPKFLVVTGYGTIIQLINRKKVD
ncbi:heavy metal-binding domain-containing protein [Limosilactobacillus kribbianus]|uniref:heavy metal-binding domain-containing protein n=1 Tax=Limosilactobacillus kribbianus TaxID=2982695 RepID=UPI0022640612|nr:heavy metal-binding domain-containing protein [Limosilactobacillus kribbianus]